MHNTEMRKLTPSTARHTSRTLPIILLVLGVGFWAGFASAATIQVSCDQGVLGLDGVTPLVGNGESSLSGFVQCIWVGPNGVIDPPDNRGLASGDDEQLEIASDPGVFVAHIGEGYPFDPDEGRFVEDFFHTLQPGDQIFLRVWDTPIREDGGAVQDSHYGESGLYTLTREQGESHDFSAFSTDTLFHVDFLLDLIAQGEGSISTNPEGSLFPDGAMVEVFAEPASSVWEFNSWQGDLTGSFNPDSIIMDADKSITAIFSLKKFRVVTATNAESMGTVDVDPVSVDTDLEGFTVYQSGTQITVTATPQVGFEFLGWDGDFAGEENPSIVTTVFDRDLIFSAVFGEKITHTLTRLVEGEGEVTVSDAGPYPDNAIITLQAVPFAGWIFTQWEGDLPAGITTEETKVRDLEVTMDQSRSIRAVFKKLHALSVVSSDPERGSSSVIPNPVQNFLGESGYVDGTSIVITATPTAENRYVRWDGTISNSVNPLTTTITNNISLVAVFESLQTFTVTVSTGGTGTGHSVTLNPPGGSYTQGQEVTATAVAAADHHFVSWQGDLTGTVSPKTFTVEGNMNITALFELNTQFSLVLDKTGNGTVTKTPDKTSFSSGEVVSLMATPDVGWTFDRWSGDVGTSTSGTTINLTMNKDRIVTAIFSQQQFNLDTAIVGQGQINVTSSDTKQLFGANALLTLTAAPATGWIFDRWTGSRSGTLNPETLLLNGNKAVTAVFIEDTCDATEITSTYPEDGSILFIPEDTTNYKFTLVAVTDCLEDVSQIEYFIDDVSLGIATKFPFTRPGPDPATLSLGESHVLRAVVALRSQPGTPLETTANFTVRQISADLDSNADGLPDDPFTTLANDGDQWTTIVSGKGANQDKTKQIGVKSFLKSTKAAKKAVTLSVTAGDGSGVVATVTLSKDLIQVGERGMIILNLADDLDALFDNGDGLALAGKPLPAGALAEGTYFVELSLLIINADGTLSEVDDSRLDQRLLSLTLDGLQLSTDQEYTFVHHPTDALDTVDGIVLTMGTGDWTTDNIDGIRTTDSVLKAILHSLSVFAAFEKPDTSGPVLQVNKNLLDFGTVLANETKDLSLVVTNAGSGTLTGELKVTAPFSIVGSGSFLLATGLTKTITVRYTASTTGQVTRSSTITSTGGSASLQLKGTRQEKTTGSTGGGGGGGGGCTGGGDPSRAADLLLTGATLGLMLLMARRRRSA